LRIDYTLFRMPAPIPVELNVYDLRGRPLGQVDLGLQGAGPHRVEWDGRDGSGVLLPPGMYLLEIALRAELKTFRHLQPVGVAY
ncbi:MAG: FlgD immunoglobulin-like domain containing protein, partial [Candidatus Latescibacterota bacterium]|nr:FlgD immunoglobulin-like domain containing protein [Candidatus Latescibacterota bacterium]